VTVEAPWEVRVPDAGSPGGAGPAPEPPMPTAGASQPSIGVRWRAVPRRWRIALVLLAALAGADVVVSLVGSSGSTGVPASSGTSSSFDPSAQGTEAMADLLARSGHRVTRLQESFSANTIALSTTLIVADPVTWDAGETRAVSGFVRSGGRVVLAGGPFNSSVLRTLLGTSDVPVLSPVGVVSARAVGNAPEVAGVSVVDADPSDGAWDQAGATTPVLRSGGASLALVDNVGAGRVVLLASASPLRNEFLGDADNAAFALNLAGGPGRAVAFDEYAHGFGPGGLGSLPSHWRWAFLVAGLAVVVWMWSAGRRFGPPEHAERTLAPARIEYVEGLATVLAATDARRLGEALSPVHRAARASLCRRVGVPDDTTDELVAGAALSAGLADGLVRAVLVAPTDTESALATGRAHAWLEQERRSHR
jgi:Domain of unknown function (DUF4350)